MTQQTGAPPAEVIEPEQTDEQLIEAERRVPDVAQYGGGVSSDSQHTALRASVRQLGQLLGEALTRHEGPELLAKVETIRRLSREHRDDELHAELDGVDDATAVRLARAFSAYFQLVNITEQLHRWREVANVEMSPLTATARRIGAALEKGTVDRQLVTDVLGRLEYRPVFTAHPTEASRRSVLELLRKIADVVAALEDSRRSPSQRPQQERRLAELVDLLWQTDELRVVRPEPKDEARTATYYLQSIAGQVMPDLLAELDRALDSIGVELPPGARPLRFGSWAGGDRDGNPNVTPPVTLDVLALQHEFGLRTLIAGVEELLSEMSASTRIVGVTEQLR
jgi:phosphoenolpyruvate carboxylase